MPIAPDLEKAGIPLGGKLTLSLRDVRVTLPRKRGIPNGLTTLDRRHVLEGAIAIRTRIRSWITGDLTQRSPACD